MAAPLVATSCDLLILNQSDNIAVLKRPVAAGSLHQAPDGAITVNAPLGMGHKVAIRAIARGENVVKYGAPIGFAAQNIAAGDHVHLHNLTSRYTIIQDMEAPTHG